MSSLIITIADKIKEIGQQGVIFKISASEDEGIKLALVRKRGMAEQILSEMPIDYERLYNQQRRGDEEAIKALFEQFESK